MDSRVGVGLPGDFGPRIKPLKPPKKDLKILMTYMFKDMESRGKGNPVDLRCETRYLTLDQATKEKARG